MAAEHGLDAARFLHDTSGLLHDRCQPLPLELHLRARAVEAAQIFGGLEELAPRLLGKTH